MSLRVLLTGFEPFGGELVNPALEAVQRLSNKTWACSAGRIEVLTQIIPTVFGKSLEVLAVAIDAHNPDIVICVGQAGGRAHITPERVAINIDDARIADNEGNQRIDTRIIADGPVAYWSGLPIKRIVQALHATGVPASVSNSAGTYVCNHLFYGLMHLIHTTYPEIRGGFVHIPFLPEQVGDKPYPSMSLETIVKGLEIMITTVSEHTDDIVVTAGVEC